MKAFLVSVVPVLATGSGVGVIVNTGDANNNSLNLINTSAQSADIEISDKNIEEIANISKLKTQNKIDELVPENLNTITTAKSTSFLTTHYSNISVNKFIPELEITNIGNRLGSKQTDLGDLLKIKINLDKKKTAYEGINSHIITSPITKTSWTIKQDAETSQCKIESFTSTPHTIATPPCYDWHVPFIDVDEKIKTLLASQTALIQGI